MKMFTDCAPMKNWMCGQIKLLWCMTWQQTLSMIQHQQFLTF